MKCILNPPRTLIAPFYFLHRMSSMDQYYVIQNFKSYLAARAFLCQDYQKCLVTTSSRRHSKSSLTGQFFTVTPLSFTTLSTDWMMMSCSLKYLYDCTKPLEIFLHHYLNCSISLPQLAWEKRLCCCCCI